jgi:hypothetical protein
MSGQQCVWYRAITTHRSWKMVETGTGQNRRRERRENSQVVSDEQSEAPRRGP